MLKNRYGFIPKRYRQPEQYRMIFTDWVAVYRHPETGEEYHIELNSYFLNHAYAKDVSVLVQCKDCRRQIGPSHKTIKDAVADLERILQKSAAPENPKEKSA